MARIVIQGLAAVFEGDVSVTDARVMSTLDGIIYDEERFTDYLGGPEAENDLAAALEPGGNIRFAYEADRDCLVAMTEYRSKRPLTEAQIQMLMEYTMGQWSDGIGENWTYESAKRCGYSIMCLTPGDRGVPREYPIIRIVDD